MKRAKKHRLPQPPAVRDPVARSPLLRKGGAHGKSTGAKRRAAKVALAKEIPGDRMTERRVAHVRRAPPRAIEAAE